MPFLDYFIEYDFDATTCAAFDDYYGVNDPVRYRVPLQPRLRRAQTGQAKAGWSSFSPAQNKWIWRRLSTADEMATVDCGVADDCRQPPGSNGFRQAHSGRRARPSATAPSPARSPANAEEEKQKEEFLPTKAIRG